MNNSTQQISETICLYLPKYLVNHEHLCCCPTHSLRATSEKRDCPLFFWRNIWEVNYMLLMPFTFGAFYAQVAAVLSKKPPPAKSFPGWFENEAAIFCFPFMFRSDHNTQVCPHRQPSQMFVTRAGYISELVITRNWFDEHLAVVKNIFFWNLWLRALASHIVVYCITVIYAWLPWSPNTSPKSKHCI